MITGFNSLMQLLENKIRRLLQKKRHCTAFYHPANENLSGLLLQYIAKLTSFEGLTIHRIVEIQQKLKNRARKRFNFETANYGFNQKSVFAT
jgi:IS30 family transposase